MLGEGRRRAMSDVESLPDAGYPDDDGDNMSALLSEKVLELKETVKERDVEIARLRAELSRVQTSVAMNAKWQQIAVDVQRQNEALRRELMSASGQDDEAGRSVHEEDDKCKLRAIEGELEQMRLEALSREQALLSERRAWQGAVDQIGKRLEALMPRT